jgi:hypothetical protein
MNWQVFHIFRKYMRQSIFTGRACASNNSAEHYLKSGLKYEITVCLFRCIWISELIKVIAFNCEHQRNPVILM